MSKYSVFSFIIIFSFLSFAQDKQKQNVELPDFVITGRNIVNIKRVNKKEPPVLDVISKLFLQPVYSTDILKVKLIESENITPLKFKKKENTFDGGAELKGGIYAIPKGSLFLSKPFTNGMFHLNVDGANMKAHVDNSDYTTAKGSIGIDFFVKNNSEILPGTKISINGKYGTKKYKFYAIANPKQNTLRKGNVSFVIQKLLNKHFAFSFKIDDSFYSFKDEYFDENLLDINGFVKLGLEKFDVASNIIYKKQSLRNSFAPKLSSTYLFANPRANFNFIDKFKVSLGFTYSHITGNNYYSPYASVSIGLGNSVTIVGEYSPQADFITQGMLLDENRYFGTWSFTNLFFKKTNSIDVSLKYEYSKFFEIDLGVNYYSTPNQYYFKPTLTNGPIGWDGSFHLLSTSAKSYSGYIKLLINPGDNGLLTAILKYHSLENDLGNKIPYSPLFKIFVAYGFNYNENIKIEQSVKFNSSTFADFKEHSGNKFVYRFKFKNKQKSKF